MAAAADRFGAAVEHVKQSTQKVANADKLKFYGLFKQAAAGDCAAPAPSRFSAVAYAKWDAWNGLRGTSKEDAKQQYVELVSGLFADFAGPGAAAVASAAPKEEKLVMMETLEKDQGASQILMGALACLAVSGVGIVGFLLTTLSPQALFCVTLIFGGIGGAIGAILHLHSLYGLLPLYPKWMQRILLERTMIETILDGTIVQQWLDYLAEIRPIFYCKTPEDRIIAVQHMAEETRRKMTTRGVVNLLPMSYQRLILSKEQFRLQKERLRNEAQAYKPPLDAAPGGAKKRSPSEPQLDIQRKLATKMFQKSMLDSVATFAINYVNPQLCAGASAALSLSFIVQLISSDRARQAVKNFIRGMALRGTSIGAAVMAVLAILHTIASGYARKRRNEGVKF